MAIFIEEKTLIKHKSIDLKDTREIIKREKERIMDKLLNSLTNQRSVLGGLSSIYGVQEKAAEALKNNLNNHTIIGRVLQGNSFGEAIKNDFYEDTVVGGIMQGKTLNEALFDSRKNSLFGGYATAGLDQVVSLFSSDAD